MGTLQELTEVELEFMKILWGLGAGTVRDVMGGLPQDRDLAYTSVSTVLRILEKKGILKTKKTGKTHVYIPTLSKDHYEKHTVKTLVSELFDGSSLGIVKCLVETQGIHPDEIKQLKALIEGFEGEKK